MAKRYTVNDIVGLSALYKASPGAAAGIGQLVFASYSTGSTVMGQLASGSSLTPSGIRPTFCTNQNSSCANSSCVTNGFSIGSGTYVALGAVGETGGATLWRRIS